MLLRILLVGALIFTSMVVIKHDHVLQRTGVVHSCTNVAAPPGDTSTWKACRAGKLEGQPDLTRDSCTEASASATLAYWRCPAPVEATAGRP